MVVDKEGCLTEEATSLVINVHLHVKLGAAGIGWPIPACTFMESETLCLSSSWVQLRAIARPDVHLYEYRGECMYG